MTQGSTDASHVTAASAAPAPDVGCRADKGDFRLISIQGARQHHLIATLLQRPLGNVCSYPQPAHLPPGAGA